MKKGSTIEQLATKLADIRDNSRDFIVPTSGIHSEVVNGRADLIFTAGNEALSVSPTNYAHGQVATYIGAPKQYYDKINTENTHLLTQMINHGLMFQASKLSKRGKSESRLIRSYNGDMRALLSSSYRMLDCHDLMENVYPMIMDAGLELESCELTERKMYLKLLSPRLKADIKVGDTVQYGLVISGSDVGAGSIRIEPLNYHLVCGNGMIMETALRKYHVGRNMAAQDSFEIMSDKTKALTDAAFWNHVKDVLEHSLREDVFQAQVEMIRQASNEEITKEDIKVVIDDVAREIGVTRESTKVSVLNYLAKGADGAGLNKWGLANGFTYAAQADDIDYEEATELERAGAKVIDLSDSVWKKLAV